MTSLDAAPRPLRAQRGPPVRRRPDRGQHPRRPRRARRQVPRPGVQPGHDHLGLPLPGPQRRPQLPRRRRRGSSPTGRASGLEACSPNTASYCNARGRLPTGVLRTLARRTAQQLQAGVRGGVEVERAGRVHRRRVARLHARHAGEPGGLPAAGGAAAGDRLPAGPGRRAAVAGDRRLPRPGHRPVRGQGHRRDHPAAARCTTRCQPGDVVLADALFDNYFLACELRERGIDLVARVQCGAGGEPDGARAGPTATSSSGSGPTSRAG